MAFFQFRKGRDEHPAPGAPAPTVEAVRRRAIHRLIGAALLVLAGVIGFPLVFDNQPRPIPVDLPIEIADKNKVKPLVVPPVAAPVVSPAVPEPRPSAVAAPAPVPPIVPAAPVAAAPSVVAAPEPPAVAPVTKARPATVAEAASAKASDAVKARALLEGKGADAQAVAPEGRFVVQVGAFSDLEKMRDVRRKVEGAGLKTYTQVVETKDGSRTRVRVGPFPDKTEASRVAEKIRRLDLPAAILAL